MSGIDPTNYPQAKIPGRRPMRTIDLAATDHLNDGNPNFDGYPREAVNPQLAYVKADTPTVEPGNRIGPDNVPGLLTSAPPADPASAARLAQLERENGDLKRSIGEMRSSFETKMEEMALGIRIQLAAAAGQPAGPQLPDGVDPSAPVTAGEFASVLGRLLPAMDAQSMRRGWDVTPEEEQTVTQRNPAILSLAEPNRTQMIQQAVHLLRKSRSADAPTAGDPGAGDTAFLPPGAQAVRTARPVVPANERSAAGAGPADTVQPTELARLMADYERAKSIPDAKKRLETQKALYTKILQLQGLTPESVNSVSWTMK